MRAPGASVLVKGPILAAFEVAFCWDADRRRPFGVYRFAAGYSLIPSYMEHERRNPISPGPGTLIGRAAMTRQVIQIEDAWTDPLYEQKAVVGSIAPGQGTVVGRAAMDKTVVRIDDAWSDSLYEKKEDAQVAGVRSMIGVPLMREGQPIGVIALARGRVEPFAEREIELVTTFADQAAMAIENVRLFDAEQQRTRELAKSSERLRTAQDRLVQTQKLASLGQLIAGIAHEIKNPTQFVNNFSAVSAELLDELQENLGKVQGGSNTFTEIAELTNTLRDNLQKIVQHGKRADQSSETC
jgi:GAF domain-containing protein